MIVIGLDLSLVKSGIAILKDNGVVLSSGLIKSSPSGELPVDEARRIAKIADDIIEKINKILPYEDQRPDLIVIENLAFMARNTTALTQLAGLSYYLRILFVELGWKFVMVAPTSLKKFITGSGKGDKSLMMMEVFKDYGFESLDDNVCDAYSLAICGLALLDKPIKKMVKSQEEVINLLKKQL